MQWLLVNVGADCGKRPSGGGAGAAQRLVMLAPPMGPPLLGALRCRSTPGRAPRPRICLRFFVQILSHRAACCTPIVPSLDSHRTAAG